MLVACGLFLWMQKDVRLSASLSFLITAGLIVFFFPRQLGLTEGTAFTAGLVFRLRCVRDEMLTGAMLFSAVFLLNEPYTCAHHRLGRILYGVMVGAFTMASATSASTRRASASPFWRSTASPAGSTAPKSASMS